MKMQQRTLASMSLSPYQEKWIPHRWFAYCYLVTLWKGSKNPSQLVSVFLIFHYVIIIYSAGIMQISGPARVHSRHAHHHLRCDQTRPRIPQCQLVEVIVCWVDSVVTLEDFCVALFLCLLPNCFLHTKWRRLVGVHNLNMHCYCWEFGTYIYHLLLEIGKKWTYDCVFLFYFI